MFIIHYFLSHYLCNMLTLNRQVTEVLAIFFQYLVPKNKTKNVFNDTFLEYCSKIDIKPASKHNLNDNIATCSRPQRSMTSQPDSIQTITTTQGQYLLHLLSKLYCVLYTACNHLSLSR